MLGFSKRGTLLRKKREKNILLSLYLLSLYYWYLKIPKLILALEGFLQVTPLSK